MVLIVVVMIVMNRFLFVLVTNALWVVLVTWLLVGLLMCWVTVSALLSDERAVLFVLWGSEEILLVIWWV